MAHRSATPTLGSRLTHGGAKSSSGEPGKRLWVAPLARGHPESLCRGRRQLRAFSVSRISVRRATSADSASTSSGVEVAIRAVAAS